MSAQRLRMLLFTVPAIAMSIGCASGHLMPFVSDPLPADRMMVIGQMFEGQQRYSQAAVVYQEMLQNDPVSPAAERLLAVIAADEVAHSQELPVDRLMSVGEFYERNGNLTVARDIYRQILTRQPDFDPARQRLQAIATHRDQKLVNVSPTPISQTLSAIDQDQISQDDASTQSSMPLESVVPTASSVREAALNEIALADCQTIRSREPESLGDDICILPAEGANRQVSSGQAGRWLVRQPDLERANGSDEVFELPVEESAPDSRFVSQVNAVQRVDVTTPEDSLVPPAPAVILPGGPQPATSGGRTNLPNANAKNAAAELWRDKPLHELNASISLKLPNSERLRDTEQQRLAQAAPYMMAEGEKVPSIGQSRRWLLSNYEWEAPATRHLPLFFEEPNLERMGYTYGVYWKCCGYESGPCAAECLQPFVSAAHFWGRVAFIPYIWGIDAPYEPGYTLGVDRPGSPVPYRGHRIPISLKGAIYQAGVMTGLAYIP